MSSGSPDLEALVPNISVDSTADAGNHRLEMCDGNKPGESGVDISEACCIPLPPAGWC